jgi:hypothetical protein
MGQRSGALEAVLVAGPWTGGRRGVELAMLWTDCMDILGCVSLLGWRSVPVGGAEAL